MIFRKLTVLFFLLILLFPFLRVERSVSKTNILIGSEEISLQKRYPNEYVNSVFKDNILLDLAYLRKTISKKTQINWDEIRKPFEYKFTLLPNQTFAFHNDVLPQYKNSLVVTTNANFNYEDGFKSDGYLMGDGVCHLASLFYWVAKNSGLDTYAPTNHNFAVIPEISKEYGVSIYKYPGNIYGNSMQNLYVTNNKNTKITFDISYKNNKLKISVFEEKKEI